MTSDLRRRVYEHKHKVVAGFTARYNIARLAQFEETPGVRAAPAREKQVEGYLRPTRIALVQSVNPNWEDLRAQWGEGGDSSSLRSSE